MLPLKIIYSLLFLSFISFAQYPNIINLINGGDDNNINEAIASLPENGTLNILSGNWVCDSSIIVNKDINFIMAPSVWIEYNHPGIAIDFQSDIVRKTIKINVTRSVDWAVGNEGVKLRYTIGSDIHINVMGFEKGLHLESNHGYLGYNRIYLGDLWSNRYGVYCDINGGNGVSRNVFIAGRISVSSTLNPTLSRYGFFIQGGSTNYINNTEIAVLPGDSGGPSYPLYYNSSNTNQFINGTIEGGTDAMTCTGSSKGNRIYSIVGSIDNVIINDISNNIGTNRFVGTNGYDFSNNIFPAIRNPIAIGFYGDRVPYYILPGYTFLRKSTGIYMVKCGEIKHNANGIMLNSTYAFGRWIRSCQVKSFLFRVKSNGFGCLIVVPYDSCGTRIDSGVSQMTYDSTIFGGVYIKSVQREHFFNLSPDVNFIWVGYEPSGFYTSTIESIELYCDKETPISNAGYDLVCEGAYCLDESYGSNCIPVGGVFNSGVRVNNISPSTGDVPEWIITNRTTKIVSSDTPELSTTILVDNIDGITDNDICGVEINNGLIKEWFWTTVQNTNTGEVLISNAIPSGYNIVSGSKLITYKINKLSALSEIVID